MGSHGVSISRVVTSNAGICSRTGLGRLDVAVGRYPTKRSDRRGLYHDTCSSYERAREALQGHCYHGISRSLAQNLMQAQLEHRAQRIRVAYAKRNQGEATTLLFFEHSRTGQ